MSQFKSGDLALVVATKTGLNIGKVVTLDRMILAGERIELDDMILNVVEDGWLATGDLLASFPIGVKQVKQHGFRTKCLMPLRGDFAPEQQKSREVTE